MSEAVLPPIGMLAELTHRCPLQCAYCSNPLELLKANREMATQDWLSLFDQAADLGVLQIHLSGGEPTLRPDLETLVHRLSDRGIYTNLITAGVGIREGRIDDLAKAGLDHVQISFQGAVAATTEKIGNYRDAHFKKIETAKNVRASGLPLTINAPIHRHNIDEIPAFIDLALELDAERLEIANVQYAGWALLNRNTLMPDRAAVEHQVNVVREAQEWLHGILAIDFVTPDYFAIYPKPCMGGWARDAFMVAPDGTVLPCHAAGTIPDLVFDRFGERSLAEIWRGSPAFNAFRGTDWMAEPCRSCERKEIDWGGCRCQAMAIAGNAAATDPACVKSPLHAHMATLIEEATTFEGAAFHYRRIGSSMTNPAPDSTEAVPQLVPPSWPH